MSIRRITLSVFLITTGCASVSNMDLSKQQQQFSQIMQDSAQKEQRAQADYAEKKALLDNLVRTRTPGIGHEEKNLRGLLQTMATDLDKWKEQRKAMQSANSDLASISYSRSTASAGDVGYDRAKESIQRFQVAQNGAEAASADFGKASTDYQDLVEGKKLYYNFTPSEFHKRVQDNLREAQEESHTMQATLNTSNDELQNHTNPALHDVREGYLNEMQRLASEYIERAQKFSQLSRDMNAITAVSPNVTNLDSNWPRVQKLNSELSSLVAQLGDLRLKFDKATDKFKAPLSGAGR